MNFGSQELVQDLAFEAVHRLFDDSFAVKWSGLRVDYVVGVITVVQVKSKTQPCMLTNISPSLNCVFQLVRAILGI